MLNLPGIQLVELEAKGHAKVVPLGRDVIHQAYLTLLSLFICPLEEVVE